MHHHDHGMTPSAMGWLVLLNAGITLAQGVVGVWVGSLSLLADAAHNLSDVVSLVLSYVAQRLSGRRQTAKQTFGLQRAKILAAAMNALSLLVLAVWILREAAESLTHPEAIHGGWVMALAGLGVCVNGVSAWLMKRQGRLDLNLRAAYWHLLADGLTSLGVCLGGLVMYLWHIYWLDKALSIGIALYMGYGAWSLLKESGEILMQFAPAHIPLAAIRSRLLTLPQVEAVDHVHLWQLTDQHLHFEGAVHLKQDLPLSQVQEVLHHIRTILAAEFGVAHATLEPFLMGRDRGREEHDCVMET